MFVGVDIETTGLYPIPGSKIFCVAVNDGKSITVYEDPRKVKALMENPKITKIIHNAEFDCFWLEMLHGIRTVNIWDSKVIEQVILGDNMPIMDADKVPEPVKMELSSSLKYTLKRYGLANIKETLTGAHFAARSKSLPLTTQERDYVKEDVEYLLQLQAVQEYRLRKLDLMRVATLENLCVEITVSMRCWGLGVDTILWARIAKDNGNKALALQKRLSSSVQNWNSPAQIKKYFQSRGIHIASLSELNDEFLDRYNDPELRNLVKMREYTTSVSKYGPNFFIGKDSRYLIDPDGRVRASFMQVLNTGRYSVSNPPLHGLPREGDHRSAIVARKGHVFVRGDFSGQETGIMAAASKEELWIKALLRGEDPLSLMASLMFPSWQADTEKGCVFPKKCKCTKHKKLRQDSKEITYGIAYGAYPKSISIKIKRTVKDTSKLFDKHKKAARNLNKWLQRNADETIRTRISYSADVYKRRRTIRDPFEWMVRNVGFNNPVQSCAANMTKLAAISISKGTQIAFIWHDEIILEVPKKDGKRALKELKSVMEKAADYCTGVTGLIKVEPKIATNLMK